MNGSPADYSVNSCSQLMEAAMDLCTIGPNCTSTVVKKWGLTEQTAFFRELRFGKSIPCGSEKRCQFRQSPFFVNGSPADD